MNSTVGLASGPAIGAWQPYKTGVTSYFAAVAVNTGCGTYTRKLLDVGYKAKGTLGSGLAPEALT